MKKTQKTLRIKDSIKEEILYIAFELSHSKWKLGFSNGEKMRTVTIDARNLDQLQLQIEKAKQRFRLEGQIRVVSCYEPVRNLIKGRHGKELTGKTVIMRLPSRMATI